MTHVLYNPLSNNKSGEQSIEKLKELLGGEKEQIEFSDITKITDITTYLQKLDPADKVILSGGDGTMNRFVNDLGDYSPVNDIYHYPAGSGNDFMNDMGSKAENGLVKMNAFFRDLPVVTVNGKDYRFLNGIGYGIDGYCCEVGDQLKLKSDKPINYAGIAIKGLLFHFKPRNATVTVDGVTKRYEKVWLAPTMNGRFYGGGMNVAPAQDRLNKERKVSVVLMYGSGKLKTLAVFPSIFKGEHIKHTEMVEVLTGNSVKVEFDMPTALQVDGETVLGVTSYTVKTGIGLSLENKDEKVAVAK